MLLTLEINVGLGRKHVLWNNAMCPRHANAGRFAQAAFGRRRRTRKPLEGVCGVLRLGGVSTIKDPAVHPNEGLASKWQAFAS